MIDVKGRRFYFYFYFVRSSLSSCVKPVNLPAAPGASLSVRRGTRLCVVLFSYSYDLQLLAGSHGASLFVRRGTRLRAVLFSSLLIQLRFTVVSWLVGINIGFSIFADNDVVYWNDVVELLTRLGSVAL